MSECALTVLTILLGKVSTFIFIILIYHQLFIMFNLICQWDRTVSIYFAPSLICLLFCVPHIHFPEHAHLLMACPIVPHTVQKCDDFQDHAIQSYEYFVDFFAVLMVLSLYFIVRMPMVAVFCCLRLSLSIFKTFLLSLFKA